jgi:hypothetical protein
MALTTRCGLRPELRLVPNESEDSMKRSKEPQLCCTPGCTQMGKVRVENDNWMCYQHITERINSPGNMAATEADQELEDFRDNGGKVS